jgi:menaquinone-9 beta-reductase
LRQPRFVDAAVRAGREDQRVFHRMVALGLADGVFDIRTIGRICTQFVHPSAGKC